MSAIYNTELTSPLQFFVAHRLNRLRLLNSPTLNLEGWGFFFLKMFHNSLMNILQKFFTDYYEEIIYRLHPPTSVIENVDKMIKANVILPLPESINTMEKWSPSTATVTKTIATLMKPNIEELRKKYIDNPPEDMTSKNIRLMSEDALLDMYYFLNDDELDDDFG